MNRARTTRNGLLVALALAPALAAGAGVVKPRVAVMAVSGGASTSSIAARAAAEAARRAGADAVSPDDVTSALRATNGDAACATDAACAVAACAAVGADYVLAAYVAESESGWRIELRLHDGQRGSLRGQGAETVPREERLARESAERLAQRLVGSLFFSAGELPPPALAPRVAASLPLPGRGTPMPARTSRRTVGNVLLGTGAALLAGAATTGALAWSASNDANASLARGDLGGFGSARRSSRTLAWTGAALGGAGVVALAAGAWLRLGGRSSPVAVGLEPAAPGVRVAVAF